MMESQPARQYLSKSVHLLQIAVLLRHILKPNADLFFDERLFFRCCKDMQRCACSSLFNHFTSRQKIETWQQISIAQGGEHFARLWRSTLHKTPGFRDLFFFLGQRG